MVDILQMKKDNVNFYPVTDVKAIKRLTIYTSSLIDLGGGLSFNIVNFLSNYSINFYGVVTNISSGRTVKTNVIPSDFRPIKNMMVRATLTSGDSIETNLNLVLLLLTTGDIHILSNGVPSRVEVGFNISWIG